ncbi:MAG: hypothetical protein ACR2IS_04140 [Nitrososphaeraceae archaeon]
MNVKGEYKDELYPSNWFIIEDGGSPEEGDANVRFSAPKKDPLNFLLFLQ